MSNFCLDPVFSRPQQIQTLADATTSLFTDMRVNPEKFGTAGQRTNLYFLVRRTEETLCLHLGRSRDEIALEELLNLDDALIRVALEKGIDRKHASIFATGLPQDHRVRTELRLELWRRRAHGCLAAGMGSSHPHQGLRGPGTEIPDQCRQDSGRHD